MLIGLLAGYVLVCWFVGLFVCSSVCCLFSRSLGSLVCWLMYLVVGGSFFIVGWLVGWLISWLIVFWLVGLFRLIGCCFFGLIDLVPSCS